APALPEGQPRTELDARGQSRARGLWRAIPRPRARLAPQLASLRAPGQWQRKQPDELASTLSPDTMSTAAQHQRSGRGKPFARIHFVVSNGRVGAGRYPRSLACRVLT